MRSFFLISWAACLTLIQVGSALSCTLCSSVKLTTTIREDLANPRCDLVVYGRLGQARLNPDGSGATSFLPEKIIRKPNGWIQPKEMVIPKYLPGGEKNQNSRTVVFCQFSTGKLDPIRAIRLEQPGSIDLIWQMVDPANNQPQKKLIGAFERMISTEPELALDGFMEWAKAEDRQVYASASTLDPVIIRKLADAPQTPRERLGLIAFLLGSSGNSQSEKAWFEDKISSRDPKWIAARDGILAGYIRLCPDEGWRITTQMLANGNIPLQERLAAIRAVKMSQGFQVESPGVGKATLDQKALAALKGAIEQGEIADIAIDYLRQWRVPDLESTVLNSYPGKDRAPLLARGVIHYALSWPEREKCSQFLAQIRKSDPDLIREVEELAIPVGR